MAVRKHDLEPGREASIYVFPTREARARIARQRAAQRRRRAGLGLGAVALAGFLLVGGGDPAVERRESSPAPRSVVLRSGDTLWDVASRFAPQGSDLRTYVDALQELNGLSESVPAGTRLRLPG